MATTAGSSAGVAKEFVPRFALDVVGGRRRLAVAFCLSLVLVALQRSLAELGVEAAGVEAAGFGRRLRVFSTNSHTERHGVMDSLVRTVAGFFLFWMSVTILFVNEGRHVKIQTLLGLAKKSVTEIDTDQPSVDRVGELVHLQGSLTSPSRPVKDNLFPVAAPPEAVKLKRCTEMYLWVQTSKEQGGQTTYTYRMDWCGEYHDSSKFKIPSGHENPAPPVTATGQPLFCEFKDSVEVGKAVVYGEDVKLGVYSANSRVLGKLSSWQDVHMPPELLREIELQNYPAPVLSQNRKNKTCVEFRYQTSPVRPSVGDVRITFEFVVKCDISVTAVLMQDQGFHFEPMKYQDLSTAQQYGFEGGSYQVMLERDTTLGHLAGADDYEDEPGIKDDMKRGFSAFRKALKDYKVTCAKSACCCFGCYLGLVYYDAAAPCEIFAVSEGRVGPEENLATVKGESSKMLYAMRSFGFFLMWMGLDLTVDPLCTLFRYVPLFGGVLVGMISAFTLCCACAGSSSVIASAWVFYRPHVGVFFAIAVICIFALLGGIAHNSGDSHPAPSTNSTGG